MDNDSFENSTNGANEITENGITLNLDKYSSEDGKNLTRGAYKKLILKRVYE
jgi:hypothetical protein